MINCAKFDFVRPVVLFQLKHIHGHTDKRMALYSIDYRCFVFIGEGLRKLDFFVVIFLNIKKGFYFDINILKFIRKAWGKNILGSCTLQASPNFTLVSYTYVIKHTYIHEH